MSTFPRKISLPRLPEGTRAVHLVFNVTRAHLLSPANDKMNGFTSLPLGAFDLRPASHPNVISLGISTGPEVLANGRRSLVVYGLGEPAELVRIVARTDTHFHQLRATTRAPCLSDGDLLLTHAWSTSAPVTAPSGLLFGPDEYQADLNRAIAAMPTATADDVLEKQQSSYFASLNALTDGKLNGFLGGLQPTLNLHLANTSIAAGQRQRHMLMEFRAAAGLPAGTPLPPFPSSGHKHSVTEVAAAFEKARIDNLMSHDGVSEAFLAFAEGHLRLELPNLQVWSTQPSSGLFFLFGEFALLAHECGLGASWLPLARTLCLARELYVRAYPPTPGVPLDAGAYVACNFVHPAHDPDRLALLRREFAALDYEALVRRSAQQTDDHLRDLPIGP